MDGGQWRSDARSGGTARFRVAAVAALSTFCCVLCFAATASATSPPSIAKVFNPSTIALNGGATLTFTITNPSANVDPLTGVAFTDSLPSGVVVDGTPSVTNACGGTATATSGSSSVSLSGGTVGVGSSCTVSVTVQGTTLGLKTNTTGPVTSTNGGTGNTATATLSVGAPTIQQAFGATSIPLGGTTSLTFTIQNPNSGTVLHGVGFTDSLPAGLQVASAPSLTNTCGGGASAAAGSGSVNLSGATLAVSSSCSISVNVTAASAGHQVNATGPVTSTESGAGETASASIDVIAPPAIAKAFGAASIPLGRSTSLQFTVTNPAGNATSLAGITFSDTLPSGLVISTPNGLIGSCGGGTITASAGSGALSLSGATLSTSTGCTFSVNVTGTTAGAKNNITDSITSTNGGTGDAASAMLTVLAPPSVTITAPTDGASYGRGQAVNASYSCADDSSGPGIKACSGPVATGARIITGAAGAHTFTVTASSNDGLTLSKTVHYTVTAPPHSRIIGLGGSIAAGKLKQFKGTSIGVSSRVASVAIALERIAGGAMVSNAKAKPQCWTLAASGKMVSVKPTGRKCPALRFLKASGTTKWTFRLKQRLGPGRYVLTSRATDKAGRVESSFSADAGNRVTFTVR